MLLESPDVQLGWQAPKFTLEDADGAQFEFDDLMGEKGLLIAFICNHCPYVKAIIDRMVADAGVLQQDGCGVVAIMSNDFRKVPEDRPEKMLEFAADHEFTFPYLIDADQAVGRAYGAVCTPDFFGLNAAGKLQYRGRLDDAKMGDATSRKPELLEAMRMIANTGEGPTVQHASMGCSIKWS